MKLDDVWSMLASGRISDNELKQAMSTVRNTIRKRQKRLQDLDLYDNTPFQKTLDRYPNAFLLKGKSNDEIRESLLLGKRILLGYRSANVREARQLKEYLNKLYTGKSKDEINAIWAAYNNFISRHPEEVYKQGSYELVETFFSIEERFSGKGIKNVSEKSYRRYAERVDNLYAKQKAKKRRQKT